MEMQTEHDRYFKEEHEIFRRSIRSFAAKELAAGGVEVQKDMIANKLGI